MRGAAFLSILVAGATPLALIGLIVLGSTLGLVAWRPPVLWKDQFGNPNSFSGVQSMAVDNASLYVAGVLEANRTFGNPFLRKYNTAGSVLWTTMIEGIPLFLIRGIAARPDGIYVVGGGVTNTTLLKYDLSGNRLWSIDVATGSQVVVSSSESGIFVGGVSGHPITNQTFTGSVFFVRDYDPSGSVLWTSEYANSTSSLMGIRAIYSASSWVYILTDNALLSYDLTGKQVWYHQFGAPGFITPFSVSADSTGVYVSGTVKSSTISLPIGFLTKFDFSGSIVKNVTFESPDGSGIGVVLVSTGSSGVYLSMLSGLANDFVKKYDFSGNEVWRFETSLNPDQLMGLGVFLVNAGTDRFYLAGATRLGSEIDGVVQALSGSSSLVFFGLNPPVSFVVLVALIALAIFSLYYLRRNQIERRKRHPPSASLDRYEIRNDEV